MQDHLGLYGIERAPANKVLYAEGPPANNFLFTGGPPANNFLFAGGPPANKFLFAGGPPANNLFQKNYMDQIMLLIATCYLLPATCCHFFPFVPTDWLISSKKYILTMDLAATYLYKY